MSPTRLSADTCPCAATNSGVPSSTKDVYVAAASLGGLAISSPVKEALDILVSSVGASAKSSNNSSCCTV